MAIRSNEVPARVRTILEDEILKIRFIQKGNNMPSSHLFRIIGNIFRETDGGSEDVFIVYLIRQLERHEQNKSREQRRG